MDSSFELRRFLAAATQRSVAAGAWLRSRQEPAFWALGLVLVLAVLGLGAALRGSRGSEFLGAALIFGTTLVLVHRLAAGNRSLRALLVAALVARVALLLADLRFGLVAKYDAGLYHDIASQLADAWWAGHWPEGGLAAKFAIYEVFVAGPLYFVFGNWVLLPRLVNAAVGVVVVWMVHRHADRLWGDRAALAAAALGAFLPSLVQVQGENLHDAIILLCIVSLMFWLPALELRPKPLALFLAVLGVLLMLRPLAAFVVMLTAVLYLLADAVLAWRLHTADRRRKAVRVAALGSALGLPAAAASLAGIPSLDYYLRWLSVPRIQGIRNELALGATGYLKDVKLVTWGDVAAYLPLGAVYFLFTPFPGQVDGAFAGLASLESLALLPLLAMAVFGLRRARRDPRAWTLVLFAVLGVLLFGLLETNIGTAVRHRAAFTWAVFILAGPVLAEGLAGLRAAPQNLRLRFRAPQSPSTRVGVTFVRVQAAGPVEDAPALRREPEGGPPGSRGGAP